MLAGLPKEIENHEYRLGLLPFAEALGIPSIDGKEALKCKAAP